MDKQSILIMLGANLDKYGVPEDEIIKNVKMFERYLNSLTPEEYEKETENIDVDLIAENIYELIKKRSMKPVVVPEKIENIEKFKTEIPEDNEDIFSDMDFDNSQEIKSVTDLPDNNAKLIPVEYEQVKKIPPPIDFDNLEEVPIEEMPQIKGTPAFWAIFFLTLPITIPIIIAIFAVLFSVIAAMAVTIVGLIGALIGIVAAGSALSLIGIVYGVTQTFTTLPIGLYEIGLGILIGGIAMFAGILVYNFAVRFLPFAIKNVLVFIKFVIKKIKYLFYFLKKESAVR